MAWCTFTALERYQTLRGRQCVNHALHLPYPLHLLPSFFLPRPLYTSQDHRQIASYCKSSTPSEDESKHSTKSIPLTSRTPSYLFPLYTSTAEHEIHNNTTTPRTPHPPSPLTLHPQRPQHLQLHHPSRPQTSPPKPHNLQLLRPNPRPSLLRPIPKPLPTTITQGLLATISNRACDLRRHHRRTSPSPARDVRTLTDLRI
ncbi:hypothetical protein EJ03DRAFT_133612 [Teratosphaeria nubilosa]|uniref:Uncharacterized protein n=1 Tax=Teratosphaeria nubilosa TaxID=161662 RepID=A0A6G1L6D6_9PEZI|nr:hypothetical protein EJ03DRAFT_133612 [Teratosphaeria nubilosa]